MTTQTFTESDLKTVAIGDGKFDYSIADQTSQVTKNADGTWDLNIEGEIVTGHPRKQDAKKAAVAAMLAILNKPVEEAPFQGQVEEQTATAVEMASDQTEAVDEKTSSIQNRRKAKDSSPMIVDPATIQTHEDKPGQFTISVVTSTGVRMATKRIYQTLAQVQNAAKRYLSHWNKDGGICPKKWAAV